MKQVKIIFIVTLTIFIIGCTSNKNTNAAHQFKKEAGKTYFNILQLNDVYEIAPIQGGKFGGMARVATVHQTLLKEEKNRAIIKTL